MSRQPKNNRFFAAAAIAVIAVALLAVLGFSRSGVSRKGFNGCPAFPVDSYVEGDSLWSNTDYVISGTFQNILVKRQGSDCTLCSILTDDKKIPLPVIFSPSATKTPLQREQRIKVKVRVEDTGKIIASDCMIQ